MSSSRYRVPLESRLRLRNPRTGLWRIGTLLVLFLMTSAGQAAPLRQTTPTSTPQLIKPILLTDPVADPHQEGVLYFPETGHTLRGKFLQYWQQYGGLAQFGYPLTEEFFEPSGPNDNLLQVQYFERNHFEMHPENAGTQYEVLLGALGRDFHTQDPPAPQQPTPALYFPETGHSLSGTFREYWESHGGLFVHGYPISEPAMERSTNGKEYLVQWFERSRFELHPENTGSPYEVLLGVLGSQLSEKKGYPFGWYPLLGHATDFSWVAGEMSLYNPITICASSDCGCVLLRSGNSRQKSVQLVQARNPQKPIRIEPHPKEAYIDGSGDRFVVFGRLASPDDGYFKCPRSADTPGYLVMQLQGNPASH